MVTNQEGWGGVGRWGGGGGGEGGKSGGVGVSGQWRVSLRGFKIGLIDEETDKANGEIEDDDLESPPIEWKLFSRLHYLNWNWGSLECPE